MARQANSGERCCYDGLPVAEQAVARNACAAKIASAIASLDLAAEFAHTGRRWAELDDRGVVVIRD